MAQTVLEVGVATERDRSVWDRSRTTSTPSRSHSISVPDPWLGTALQRPPDPRCWLLLGRLRRLVSALMADDVGG
jgi:hypothetical protein